jgi:hypothetical protein
MIMYIAVITCITGGVLVNEQEQQPTLTHQLVFRLMYNDQQII